MKNLFLISILVLLTAPLMAVDFSEAQIAGSRVTVCRVDMRKETLELFLRDESGKPYKRFKELAAALDTQGRKLTFAMNAGMYHGDFSPVGLFVSGGKQISPLNLGDDHGNFFLKPNGVFLVTTKGARVVESTEYPKLKEPAILATQSGPLLLRNGKIHPAFNADSKSRLYRNGVGVPSPDTAIFVITEQPVNFHEFALLFRDVLHCPDALFLDGTISSLHSTRLNRSDFKMDLGPIIGVTEKK
jgi:uncharacterized protein YigE (DUF2233 family)